MDFEGWMTDHTRSLQGITDDEVLMLVSYLEKMIPTQAHQGIDGDQTRKEQGNLADRNGGHHVMQKWLKLGNDD